MGRRAILLLGIQGAGKGTLAASLADHLSGVHLSAGTLLRERARDGGPVAAEIQERIDRGLGAPTEISYGLLEERLDGLPDKTRLVLDGFPREIAELPRLERLLGAEAETALLLRLPRPIAVDRLLRRRTCEKCDAAFGPGAPPRSVGHCDRCGGGLVRRPDDTPRALTHRLDGWSERGPAIVDHFRRAGTLIEIDATLPTISLARRALELVEGASN